MLSIYNGLSEIIPANDFGEAVAGPAVEPEAYPIEEVSTDMMHQYIKLLSVTMDSVANTQGRNFTLTDETGDMIMRMNFNEVTIGEDFDFDATYNVEGFLAFYKSSNGETQQLQFYPNLIEKVGGAPVPGDVNGDGTVTAADVTMLYNIILNDNWTGAVNADQNGDGSVTAGDVTAVYNILLQ